MPFTDGILVAIVVRFPEGTVVEMFKVGKKVVVEKLPAGAVVVTLMDGRAVVMVVRLPEGVVVVSEGRAVVKFCLP